MGTGDGYVLPPATKLSEADHGSSADRWDIVLVAEGFRAEDPSGEQSLFTSKVDEFAERLFYHFPFSSLEIELAFNIWKLHVVSTDSGVDDPTACGGTGDAPATFFDGTLCDGGVTRALSVDWDLVMNSVDANVPHWNSIVVVVNSALEGGATLGDASGTTGPVSAVTTYGDWVRTAIHELGHQFGLEDEYDSLKGCQYDEPDHYKYLGPEPIAPNVTKDSNLAMIKWDKQVTPTATAVLSLDCTKCGPAKASPLPLDTTGAFEGAGTFHCGLFRPQFFCVMRNALEFCSVCQLYLIDLFATYSAYQAWPSDKAPDVDPWPATLSWTPGNWESAWDIEITDAPDFSGQIQALTTTKTQVVNGQTVAYEPVWLKPGTKYTWRMRKVLPAAPGPASLPPTAVWTPPTTRRRTFTTAPKKVELLSPWTGKPPVTWYPWGLEFSWKEVDGADHYEVQVADESIVDPDPDPFSSSKLIYPTREVFASPVDGTVQKKLDVKVKAKLRWRARAIPPEGPDYAGEWSKPLSFSTQWPKVTIVSPGDPDPSHAEPVYPWPVELRWQDVPGAARYDVDLTRKKGQWGAESEQKPLDFTPPTTHVDLNLRPRPFADHQTHKWRVRVWGPTLPSTPPLQEQGQDSGWYWFVNDGDKTIPALIDCAKTPGSSGADGIHWMSVNGSVPVAWQEVTNAQAWWLQFMNFGDQTTDPIGIAWKDTLYYEPPEQVYLTIHPPPTVGVTGYWWKATAIGPEELPGLDDGTFGRRCYVLPDVPELLEPPAKGIDDPGDYGDIGFRFTSAYTPSGKYRLIVVWGPPVGGATPTISGNPGGITEFGPWALGLSGLKPNTAYQWMVKAHSDIPAAAGGVSKLYPLSEMRNYVTKETPPPPPPPPQFVGGYHSCTNLTESYVKVFTPVGVTQFHFEYQEIEEAADPNAPSSVGELMNVTWQSSDLAAHTSTYVDLTGDPVPTGQAAVPLPGLPCGIWKRVRGQLCKAGIWSGFTGWMAIYPA